MIKKHEDFEKSLAAQEEKIKALDEFATKLIEGQHYATEDVAQRREMVNSSFKILFLFILLNCLILNILSCWKDDHNYLQNHLTEVVFLKIHIGFNNLKETAMRLKDGLMKN